VIIQPNADLDDGPAVIGTHLVIREWPATGIDQEVAPLHVHDADDEAWHVISGALRFRFIDRVLIAKAGSTVLIPAGTAHTFGNAGPEPSRYILILPAGLDELIRLLHEGNQADHAAVYARFASRMLEAPAV
jgi:mannose-6-phosphate isomerase-like protein (cupin superfamily)